MKPTQTIRCADKEAYMGSQDIKEIEKHDKFVGLFWAPHVRVDIIKMADFKGSRTAMMPHGYF